jgi:hypothetical protein
MDTLTIILCTVGVGTIVALAWLGGYEIGISAGVSAERESANRRINGVLDSINTRKPKAAKNRRKAQRKAVRV